MQKLPEDIEIALKNIRPHIINKFEDINPETIMQMLESVARLSYYYGKEGGE